MITAVLPFRSVADSKRRMESALSEQERMELSARLLVRTLGALRNARSIGRTILVSPDPLARELARAAGAEAIDDHGVPLNEAIRLGLDRATTSGASAALIVPVDLAHVSAIAIDELTEAWRASRAASALLPALDGGTAALITPLPTSMSLHYGEGSAALHLRELTATTSSVHQLNSPLAADLDTPEDLAAVTAPGAGHAAYDQHDGLIALPIDGLGEIQPNDNLPELIAEAVHRFLDERAVGPLRPDDVISVTQKIVSKAEGAIVDLATITPRSEAVAYAERWKRDARQVEVVLQEAVRVVRMDRGVIITETAHGFVLANSGVDASNVGPRSGEIVTLLPRDPDASAARIRAAIAARTGVAPGVIITDSFGRPWRLGITDVAIGLAGIAALEDLRGQPDADGRVMAATVRAVADQIAAAAELALGKSAKRPLAFIRGAKPAPTESGSVRESLMPPDWDLFR
ncbi:MAG: coenzyme F420-0:L-glutamate ligase [Chloroflexi bacterium]|nr:MAG: coenzyme F420-0:L-glutamate ligase [Chloroflexota bacterium]